MNYMKKIIITGGAGFIGSHVVEFAIENNNQVIVIDNLVSGKLSNLPDDKRVVFYQADILKDNIEYIFERENPRLLYSFSCTNKCQLFRGRSNI